MIFAGCRIDAEIEFQLALPGRHQRPDDTAERQTLFEPFVDLFDRRQIGEPEEDVGVRAQHRPDDAALQHVAQMVFAHRGIPCKQIAHCVILLPQGLRRGDTGEPAERTLGQNLNLIPSQRVQFFGTFEFVALRVGARSESLIADDQHRRAGVHVVGARATEARDERTGVLTSERTQFSGEDHDLSGKRAWQRIER